METITASMATFQRRTQNIYSHQRARAKEDRQTLAYTLEDLRQLAKSSEWCAYCRRRLDAATFTIDHQTPTCRAANHTLSNLCCCCKSCNEAKGDLNAQEFRELLALATNWHPAARQSVLSRLRAGARAIHQGR